MARDFELVCLSCMKKLPIGSRETWIGSNAEAIAAFYEAHSGHKTAALADGMWLDKQAVLQEIRANISNNPKHGIKNLGSVQRAGLEGAVQLRDFCEGAV